MAPAAGKSATEPLEFAGGSCAVKGDCPAEEHGSNYKCGPHIIPEVDSILFHKMKHEAFVYKCVFTVHTHLLPSSFLLWLHSECCLLQGSWGSGIIQVMKHLVKHCARLNRCLFSMLFWSSSVRRTRLRRSSVCLPSWCPSGAPLDLIQLGEPGEVMGPVHRYRVFFEALLRAKVSWHRPVSQMAVMALGKPYHLSDWPGAAVLGVSCVVFACWTCKLDMWFWVMFTSCELAVLF